MKNTKIPHEICSKVVRKSSLTIKQLEKINKIFTWTSNTINKPRHWHCLIIFIVNFKCSSCIFAAMFQHICKFHTFSFAQFSKLKSHELTLYTAFPVGEQRNYILSISKTKKLGQRNLQPSFKVECLQSTFLVFFCNQKTTKNFIAIKRRICVVLLQLEKDNFFPLHDLICSAIFPREKLSALQKN